MLKKKLNYLIKFNWGDKISKESFRFLTKIAKTNYCMKTIIDNMDCKILDDI